MKLKKIIKYLSGDHDVELYIEDSETPCFECSMITLQAAANCHGDKEQYIKEVLAEKDYEEFSQIKIAERFIDLKLQNSDFYEAVDVCPYINEKGAKLIKYQIYLKSKKK